MAIDMDAELPLARANRYSNPKDATAFLPRVYGDFYNWTSIPADHEDGGFLRAPLIDQFNLVYLLNDGPVPSSPRPIMYANDVAVPDDPGIYTWNPAIDYENTGHVISMVQAHVNPGNAEISWRGYGTVEPATGQLITNPIYAIMDAFGTLGGWQFADLDLPSLTKTQADMNLLGDEIHWVFQEARSYRAWLQEILRHYHTDFWEQEDGRLRFMLDRSVTTLPVSIIDVVDAQTDLVGDENTGVSYELSAQNIVNTLRISRRLKWTSLKYTDEPTVRNQASFNVYGNCYRPVELPACYTDAERLRWYRGFMARYALKPGIVRFTVRGLSLSSAMPGTFLGFVWPKHGWTSPRLLKVLDFLPNDETQTITFECFDCQRSVGAGVNLADDAFTGARRRIAEGSLAVDTTPPGPASNLIAEGSYQKVVLRWTPPGDLDYDHTEIWASFSNNRSTATFIRNGGYRGTSCEETFEINDTTTRYVWLMTVDITGNGKDGSGNWYPASSVGGVVAIATLVPTQGVETNAITFTYTSSYRRTEGTFIGELDLAGAQLGGAFQQGDVISFANARVTINSLCTCIVQIKRGSFSGTVVGVNYIVNPILAAITTRVDCWGLDFDPAWNGVYIATVQVIDQQGAQVTYNFFPNESNLFLRHTKR